jgi:hypothetical protein
VLRFLIEKFLIAVDDDALECAIIVLFHHKTAPLRYATFVYTIFKQTEFDASHDHQPA